MTVISVLKGEPSEREERLLDDFAEKNRQCDELLNDPGLNDPREARDPIIHSLVCRKRNTLHRLGDERLGIRLDILDERSARRNDRTFYLLLALVAYLIAKSIISWPDVAHFGLALVGLH